MKKRTIVAIICVLAILATCTFALVACKKVPSFLDATNLEVKMYDEYYLGTQSYNRTNRPVRTFDLSTAREFSGATSFKIKGTTDVAKISSGTSISIAKAGEFDLDVTTGDKVVTKHVYVKEGINASNYEHMAKAIKDGNSVVLHQEITFPNKESALTLKSNTGIYGNGNVLATELLSSPVDKKVGGNTVLVARGENVIMQDFKIIGMDLRAMKPEEINAFDIEGLERYGALIDYTGSKTELVSGTIKNVVAENGHKVICISGATVTMEGCIVKNAADSLISIGASDNGGTKLTMKNNVLMNAVVAGIVMYGWDVTNDFLDLKIEGFLDIYNWKERKTAKIMPSTEQFADLANSMVSGELNKKANAKYVYSIGEKKYVHSGMVVISTGDLKSNKAKINGTVIADVVDKDKSVSLGGTDGYIIRKFPVPDFASVILKTSCLIGYGNNDETSKKSAVLPEQALDTDTIYGELRNGRK